MKKENKLKRRQRYHRDKWKKTPVNPPDLYATYFKEMIDLMGTDKYHVMMRITRDSSVEIVLKLIPK